ncbi:hypothetical protein N9980_01265 [bacterium]|nr:hypothetical protein [bacterium]
MGGKSKTVDNPKRLTEEGQQQFDFAAGKLEGRFNNQPNFIGFDRSGIDRGIAGLRGFGPSQATNNRIDALANFRGTAGAKSSLEKLGKFKGSGDAFRTLGALEQFGAGEQGFVTDARNSVLNFDEGFESDALPLLLQSARGDFLSEQSGNPFVRDQINLAQRSTLDNFNESVLPNLLASFSGSGGVGSTLKAGFANQQARDLQRNLGDISSNISFNVFEAERQRQQAAQESILGFENFGLDRQLGARTANLNASQTSAQQILDARIAAGGQATQLSQQELNALAGRAQGETALSGQTQASLQGAASGRVALDAQRQAALEGALGGEISKGQLDFNTQQLNAQLENDRINQLIAAQQAAAAAGEIESSTVRRAI